MKISEAMRVDRTLRLALVGAGGKSSAMFSLAREIGPPVLLSTSTHLSWEQAGFADRHEVITELSQAGGIRVAENEILLVTGPRVEEDRAGSLDDKTLFEIYKYAEKENIPFLIEADGSRCLPLKAPADHEPAIPQWVNHVMVVLGLSGLGKPLSSKIFHRVEKMTTLTGLEEGMPIDIKSLQSLLCHPLGGLKNIPPGARRMVLLNQADNIMLRSQAGQLANNILNCYDSVIVCSLNKVAREKRVYSTYEPVGGVILAGGGSKRLGHPKILLKWRGQPFIRSVVETALQAGLSPVIVVLGAITTPVYEVLRDLPVNFVENPDWEAGQSTSLRVGKNALPANVGAAVFMLADQPQIPVDLVRKLIESHRTNRGIVIAPEVYGQRANPVLFDRQAFDAMNDIEGDKGGRALFERYSVKWLPWHDSSILLDVDTAADYQRLLDLE